MIFIFQVSSAIFWFWICWKFESYNWEEFPRYNNETRGGWWIHVHSGLWLRVSTLYSNFRRRNYKYSYRYPSEIHETTQMNPLAPYITEIKYNDLSPTMEESLKRSGISSGQYKQKKMVADFKKTQHYTVHVWFLYLLNAYLINYICTYLSK